MWQTALSITLIAMSILGIIVGLGYNNYVRRHKNDKPH